MRAAVLCAALLCLGCEKPPLEVVEEVPPPPIGGGTSQPQVMNVVINASGFVPARGTLRSGGSVRWTLYYTWPENRPHRVVADGGLFVSPILQLGKGSGNDDVDVSWSYVFPALGTFAYHCGYHPSERGTITVF